jgi:hypothetical protein
MAPSILEGDFLIEQQENIEWSSFIDFPRLS